MAFVALASLKAAAADCFAAQAGFGPVEAVAGLLAADELCALFLPLARGRATAPSVGAPLPATLRAVAAEQAPLSLLQLPPDVLVLVLCRLDACSLSRVAATCSGLYRDPARPMTPVEEALRERAAARGRVSPGRLPEGATSWVAHLAWLECWRDEALAPVAACRRTSFFMAEGWRLLSCRTEDDNLVRGVIGVEATGVLGHGELDADVPVVQAPTLLPSMAGIRLSSVSAGFVFNAAVSADGKVYTWGVGYRGRLGHGDEEGSLVSKQVQALAEHIVLLVTAGGNHCLAVTEKGEVFSWGWDTAGQCGHGSSGEDQLLPRRVGALAGVKARIASAGDAHSLVVTKEGALYSFGHGRDGQLGHGSVEDEHSPKMVDALRHVRIAAAAAGGMHSLAVTEDGAVFSWGSNTSGQLGRGQVGGCEALPQKVEALSGLKVCAVVAADDAGCAVTAAGELYTWGNGYCGRLGHGDTADQLAPTRVQALRDEWVVAVSPGESHTVAATLEGSVFGWGEADGLGLPDASTDVPEDFGTVSIMQPCRYPQLSCAPRS